MKKHWQPLLNPGLEIVPLQHLLQGHPTVQPDDLQEIHFSQPLAVKDRFRAVWIENFECLAFVGFGVGQYLVSSQHRTSCRSATRVTNHGGKVADDQNREVT